MGSNLMEWAVAIGSATGAAFSVAIICLQIYRKVIAPALKAIAPALKEITGGEDERVPGLREIVENVGIHAKAAHQAASSALEGQNLLRRDVQAVKGDLSARMDGAEKAVAKEFGVLHGRLDEQGREIGQLKALAKGSDQRLTTVETIQRQRKEDRAANATGATEAGPTTSTGGDHRESPLPPPQPSIVSGAGA